MKTIFFEKWRSSGDLGVHLAKSLLIDHHPWVLTYCTQWFLEQFSHKNPTDRGYVQ